MSQRKTINSSASFVSGEVRLAALTWTPLVATSTACAQVRISAPNANSPHGALNTGIVLVLEATSQPTGTNNSAGAMVLPNSSTGATFLPIGDASNLGLFAISANDSVEYCIYQ